MSDDQELRLALLEHEVKKHMQDEVLFWGDMKGRLTQIDTRLDDLTATRNKWLGVGIGVLTLGSIAFGLIELVARLFKGGSA